jgi:hypothetical protein
MCKWNQTQFLNQAGRFLNLKFCSRTRTKWAKNWENSGSNPHIKNLQIKFTMSKAGQDVLFKRNNCTTLIFKLLGHG